MSDFEKRKALIPDDIWVMAKETTRRFADDGEILQTAEMLYRRITNQKQAVNEQVFKWQPFLTHQQTRIILEALESYFDFDDEDAFCLNDLITSFKSV